VRKYITRSRRLWGKQNKTRRWQTNQPLNPKPSFLFLLFPFLCPLCKNCTTQKSLNNSEVRTCLAHPELQLSLVLALPRRKKRGLLIKLPSKPTGSFNEGKSARYVAHTMQQCCFIIPSTPLPLLIPRGVYGSSPVIFTILLPLRPPKFLHRFQLYRCHSKTQPFWHLRSCFPSPHVCPIADVGAEHPDHDTVNLTAQ